MLCGIAVRPYVEFLTNYCDYTGESVNSYVYDEIGDDYKREFTLGLLKVTRQDKVGFINECGKEVIPCIYDDARVSTDKIGDVSVRWYR